MNVFFKKKLKEMVWKEYIIYILNKEKQTSFWWPGKEQERE